MSATHVEHAAFHDVDDDDGMPPLVDNPNPSMTFTFATDMTPITYSTDPTGFEIAPDGRTGESFIDSPPGSPVLGPIRSSHAKKRDASYIPRPPNAFILFRSSFIRAQHIPGKIEGNHSALSKIIGKYWKTLPREEREVWEAKAIVAQAEHRQKYPDWRFRPGSNALAKVKDGPRRRNNKKGRGEAEKEVRSREKRCAKIADLLVAGKKGEDLEAAIEEYDCKAEMVDKVKHEGCSILVMKLQESVEVAEGIPKVVELPPISEVVLSSNATSPKSTGQDEERSFTFNAALDARFETPLTAMFKRSSSAPAAYARNATAATDDTPSPASFARRESFSSASSFSSPYMAYTPPHSAYHEVEPRAAANMNTREDGIKTLPLVSSSSPDFPAPSSQSQNLAGAQQWGDTYTPTSSDVNFDSAGGMRFDGDREDMTSPLHSPAALGFDLNYEVQLSNPEPSIAGGTFMTLGPNCSPYSQSSYSSLKGWADDSLSKHVGCHSLSSPFALAYPAVYDPDEVMQEAFAAAASAPYENWNFRLGLGNMACLYSRQAELDVQHYLQGLQDFNYRQENRGHMSNGSALAA